MHIIYITYFIGIIICIYFPYLYFYGSYVDIGWKDILKLTLAAGAVVVGAAVAVAAEEVLSDAIKSEQPKRKVTYCQSNALIS